MEKSRIQDIITKSILEEASSDELLLLEQRRKESQTNENLYNEYKTIWDASADYEPVNFQPNVEAAYQKHLHLINSEKSNIVQLAASEKTKQKNILYKSSNQEISSHKTRFFTLRRLTSVAALFVMAFGAMVVFNTMNTTSITAEDGVTFASLEDGSSIWLDEGSSISYKRGFGKDHRDIQLDGKAFFDVERNEKVAFNISSNDINVSVLGTSFTVDTRNDNNIVAVKSGKVAVTAKDNQITLTANEKAIFKNDEFIEETATIEDVIWRNSNLSFNNAPLEQVVADINLFHDNKIVLGNNQHLDCPFTARSLAKAPFENIIKVLESAYDIEADHQANGSVLLTITECK